MLKFIGVTPTQTTSNPGGIDTDFSSDPVTIIIFVKGCLVPSFDLEVFVSQNFIGSSSAFFDKFPISVSSLWLSSVPFMLIEVIIFAGGEIPKCCL